jgi:hypothetical protein
MLLLETASLSQFCLLQPLKNVSIIAKVTSSKEFNVNLNFITFKQLPKTVLCTRIKYQTNAAAHWDNTVVGGTEKRQVANVCAVAKNISC